MGRWAAGWGLLGRLVARVAAEHIESDQQNERVGRFVSWPKTSWNGLHERKQLLLDHGVEIPTHPKGGAHGINISQDIMVFHLGPAEVALLYVHLSAPSLPASENRLLSLLYSRAEARKL
jgi:hypothetical protein